MNCINCQENHFYGYAVYVLRKPNKLHTRIKRLVLGDLLHPVVTKGEWRPGIENDVIPQLKGAHDFFMTIALYVLARNMPLLKLQENN